MKKRLILLVLMLFAAVGFLACNTTTGGAVVTDQAGTPTNLVISGTTLSWDAVSGVSRYIVYIDGEEAATVNGTSYNFNSKIGSKTRLIFQVVAVGGTGVEDSPMSASIAYVANPATEIAAIQTAMEDSEYFSGAPDGFAEELVRKGVIGTDFTANLTALETFMTAVQNAEGDLAAINAALTAFIAAVPNYEAYVSAFVVMLPQAIDQQITSSNEDITYWEDEKTDPYSWYSDEECQDKIDEIQASIDQLTALKAALEDNSDNVTLVLTSVMAYLIEVQSNLTTTLLANIQAQIGSEDRPTAAEIVAIKDEAVNILLSHMPAAADLNLAYQVLFTLEGAIAETSIPAADMTAEMATTTRLEMELELRFLLSLDATFIDGVFSALDDSRSDVESQIEIIILVLKKINAFEDAQATLIDQVDAVFSESQKEDLFDSYIDSLPQMLALQGVPQEEIDAIVAGLSDLTYALVDAAANVFDGQAEKILDYIAGSDGEVLRLIAIAASFRNDWDYDDNWDYVKILRNDYTDTDYENETRFQVAQMLGVAAAVGGVFEALDPTLATLTESDVTAIVNLISVSLPTGLMASGDVTEADVNALINSMKTAIAAQDANLLSLFSGLVDYVNSEDVAGDFAALLTELDTWYTGQYGSDWMDGEVDQTRMMYAYAIFAAHNLDAFVTTERRALIDGIVAQAFAFMSTTEFLDAQGITLEDVTSMQEMVEGMIDDVLSQCAVIADYDYKNLTTAQETELQNFFELFNPA